MEGLDGEGLEGVVPAVGAPAGITEHSAVARRCRCKFAYCRLLPKAHTTLNPQTQSPPWFPSVFESATKRWNVTFIIYTIGDLRLVSMYSLGGDIANRWHIG